MKKYVLLFEDFITKNEISSELLDRMEIFGVNKNSIDKDGYVTMYHGGKVLPKTIYSDQIFYMTPDYDLANDYAKMRGGKVFSFKVNPNDVNWNTATSEVEFSTGGRIKNGILIPREETYRKEKKHVIYKLKQYDNLGNIFDNITDKLKRWVYGTISYYNGTKDITEQKSLIRLIDDINYYLDLYSKDTKSFREFSKDLNMETDDLYKQLSKIASLKLDDLFDQDEIIK